MGDRRRPPVAPPAWLPWVGGVMLLVGVIGFFADVASDKTGASLVIDLMLDGFLVAAGLVILLAARRR